MCYNLRRINILRYHNKLRNSTLYGFCAFISAFPEFAGVLCHLNNLVSFVRQFFGNFELNVEWFWHSLHCFICQSASVTTGEPFKNISAPISQALKPRGSYFPRPFLSGKRTYRFSLPNKVKAG